MKVLDFERMLWFLFEYEVKLLLDVVCSHSFVTYSFMIELNKKETAQFQTYGHDYLNDLASDVHNSVPVKEKSRYFGRDVTEIYREISANALKKWQENKEKFGKAIY